MLCKKSSKNHAFTLVELLVIISIVGIIIAIGFPSFSNFIDRQRVNGVGDNLFFFMKLGRSEAAKQNLNMVVSFKGAGTTNWCVGLSTAVCDCATVDACLVDGVERVLNGSDFPSVKFDSSTFDDSGIAGVKSVTINPTRGRSGSGQVNFSLNGTDVRLIRSTMGRDTICSPSGTSSRYPSC